MNKITENFTHVPVLIDTVLNYMNELKDGILIDATFGLGGYSKALLENTNCKVFALDRDPDVKIYANKLFKKYKDRFVFSTGKFSEILELKKKNNLKNIIGITFDLGLSNLQIEDSKRGFSFKTNGPLDMRMSKKGLDAEKFINTVDEKTLSSILYRLGDEVYSKRISKAILREREKEKISSTNRLAEIIRKVIPGKNFKIDKATKSFQAIRMHLNNELEELKLGLIAAENVIKPNGIIAVVSFHSNEDRIVKNFFAKCSGKKLNQVSKFLPDETITKSSFEIITKKPIVSSENEIKHNPKSRSAKLRIAKRTFSKPIHEVAAW